jgi:hypothetical protein
MTSDEKRLLKDMNKLICEMMLKQNVYETVFLAHIPDWPLKLASVISSPEYKTRQRENEKIRQGIDSLIDQNNLTSLRSLVPSNNPSN